MFYLPKMGQLKCKKDPIKILYIEFKTHNNNAYATYTPTFWKKQRRFKNNYKNKF